MALGINPNHSVAADIKPQHATEPGAPGAVAIFSPYPPVAAGFGDMLVTYVTTKCATFHTLSFSPYNYRPGFSDELVTCCATKCATFLLYLQCLQL